VLLVILVFASYEHLNSLFNHYCYVVYTYMVFCSVSCRKVLSKGVCNAGCHFTVVYSLIGHCFIAVYAIHTGVLVCMIVINKRLSKLKGFLIIYSAEVIITSSPSNCVID